MTICAKCGGEFDERTNAECHIQGDACIRHLTDRVTFQAGMLEGLASRIEIAHGAVTSLRSEVAALEPRIKRQEDDPWPQSAAALLGHHAAKIYELEQKARPAAVPTMTTLFGVPIESLEALRVVFWRAGEEDRLPSAIYRCTTGLDPCTASEHEYGTHANILIPKEEKR